MTLVFIPKETDPGESRVAATPETVKGYTKAGLEVAVVKDAGFAAGFTDAEYTEAGAQICEVGKHKDADLLLSIRPPSESTVAELKAGATLVCGLQPQDHGPLIGKLADAKVTSFAMELVPRITRAQKMDILSSQATCAGYQAVLMAATKLPRFFPLFMTAAGTIKPARVFVLGAGVAGLQAISTAKRLGAIVEANDVRAAVKEQVESLGAKFVDTTIADAETAGGYAKEATAEDLKKQQDILQQHIANSDVVITTALIPGKKAPLIVTEAMVAGMRPGSVIVDLAVAAGGNVAGSKVDETVDVNGVKIIGEPNLPSLVASDASRMWARNVKGFVDLMLKEGKLEPDWEDEVIAATCLTNAGEIKHEGAKEAAKGAS